MVRNCAPLPSLEGGMCRIPPPGVPEMVLNCAPLPSLEGGVVLHHPLGAPNRGLGDTARGAQPVVVIRRQPSWP